MARIAQGTLHNFDRDGQPMLIGETNDVKVEIALQDGRVNLFYGQHAGTANIELDISNRRFWIVMTSPRLLGLRRQAMRKGRRGWRWIR